MRASTRFTRSRRAQRVAFTLIELLVVIAIIAALIGLSASAVIKLLTVQQNNNTQSTLDRTQSQLTKAWSKVKDQAYKETIPPAIYSWIQTNLAGSDANATKRIRVIYVKLKLRQAFPMNFTEALNPSPLPQLPVYAQYLSNYGISSSSGANYESSACLLMALQRGVGGAGVNPDDLTKGGAAGVGPNGLPYLMDAWGQPIYFTRAPTGSTYLNPNGPQPGTATTPSWDPGDPEGTLLSAGWRSQYGAAYSSYTLEHPSLNTVPANTSYKLAPMLASSGMDKTVEFDPFTFAPTASGGDNLFSTP